MVTQILTPCAPVIKQSTIDVCGGYMIVYHFRVLANAASTTLAIGMDGHGVVRKQSNSVNATLE